MALYGDGRTIAEAQNLALRHIVAALRCALGPPEASRDAATGHQHCEDAIAAIEAAERAIVHTAVVSVWAGIGTHKQEA